MARLLVPEGILFFHMQMCLREQWLPDPHTGPESSLPAPDHGI